MKHMHKLQTIETVFLLHGKVYVYILSCFKKKLMVNLKCIFAYNQINIYYLRLCVTSFENICPMYNEYTGMLHCFV